MSLVGRKIWLYSSTIDGSSSIPTTSMTASIRRPLPGPSAGPVQLGHQLVPGHHVPFVPREGGFGVHLLVDLGRGLPLFDTSVLGRLGLRFVGGRLGRPGLGGAALLLPSAAPAALLAAFGYR